MFRKSAVAEMAFVDETLTRVGGIWGKELIQLRSRHKSHAVIPIHN